VPQPTIEEILEVETDRGSLMREKPGGVASKISAVVVLYPGFSKGKISIF
jgi:hypothetical protein